jgi:hypothetical protein
MKNILSRPLVPAALLVAGVILIVVWTAPLRKAHAIWEENERVISNVALKKPVDLREFREAAAFFSKLTGITVPMDQNAVFDGFPTEESAAALEPLRRWYAKNKYRLYWDDEREEVRLAFASD